MLGRGHLPLPPHRRCHPPHRPSRRHPSAGTVTEVGNEVGPVVGAKQSGIRKGVDKGKRVQPAATPTIFPWIAEG